MRLMLSGLTVLLAGCTATDSSDESFVGGKADTVADGQLAMAYAAVIDTEFAVCKRDDKDRDKDGDRRECRSGTPREFNMTTTALVEFGQDGEDLVGRITPCKTRIGKYDGVKLKVSSSALRSQTAEFEASLGDSTLVTGPAAIVLGAELDDPLTEALPTSDSDRRLVDSDDDGRAGLSLTASKDSLKVSLYTSMRLVLGIEATVNDDYSIDGLVNMDVEMSVVGDSSWLFDGKDEWEELQDERGLASETHYLSMTPVAPGTRCNQIAN